MIDYDEDEEENLAEIGVYLGTAILLNRNALDAECVSRQEEAMIALKDFGEFWD